eukprot:gene5843-4167_t
MYLESTCSRPIKHYIEIRIYIYIYILISSSARLLRFKCLLPIHNTHTFLFPTCLQPDPIHNTHTFLFPTCLQPDPWAKKKKKVPNTVRFTKVSLSSVMWVLLLIGLLAVAFHSTSLPSLLPLSFSVFLIMSSTGPKRVYFQCNPLLDISAKVDESFLKPYNLGVGEAGLAKEEQMGIYEALEKLPGVAYIPGGSGLNSARVFQWLAAAPKLSTFVGCVGKDRHAEILQKSAEEEGVEMVLEKTDKCPTGVCAVAVVGKERSLLANLSAAITLSPEHMKSKEVRDALESSQIFYLTGFTVVVDVNYVLQVAEAAHKVPGGIFVLNLSAPYIIECFTERLEKVLPHVDILIGNEGEGESLAKTFKLDVEDTSNCEQIAAAAFKKIPYEGKADRTFVFTHGAHGTAFMSQSHKTPQVEVPTPIPSEEMVDFNGAGDAFVGGFLAGLSAGKTIKECVVMGNRSAGIIIRHEGCAFPSERPAGWPLGEGKKEKKDEKNPVNGSQGYPRPFAHFLFIVIIIFPGHPLLSLPPASKTRNQEKNNNNKREKQTNQPNYSSKKNNRHHYTADATLRLRCMSSRETGPMRFRFLLCKLNAFSLVNGVKPTSRRQGKQAEQQKKTKERKKTKDYQLSGFPAALWCLRLPQEKVFLSLYPCSVLPPQGT